MRRTAKAAAATTIGEDGAAVVVMIGTDQARPAIVAVTAHVHTSSVKGGLESGNSSQLDFYYSSN